MNWYKENIEPGIRDLVRLLRDNGVNTECSCEHKMYIQFQVIPGNDAASVVDTILFNSGYTDYLIEITVQRLFGSLMAYGTVFFPKDGDYPVQIELARIHDEHVVELEAKVRWYEKKTGWKIGDAEEFLTGE
jgi:predicted oxidoreductase